MDKKEKALLNWGLVTLGTRPSSAKQALKKKENDPEKEKKIKSINVN
jgi:hypothetical protein